LGVGRVAAAAEPEAPQRSRLASLLTHSAFLVGVIDVVLVLIFGFASPHRVFFQLGNFTDMALDSAEVVLLAGGTAFLLGAGELDISLGANVILSSVVGGKAMVSLAGTAAEVSEGRYPHLTLALAVGVVAAIATGTLFGLVNGLIVTRMGVNSFIATLGTLGIGTGLGLVITNGYNIANVPTSLQVDFGIRSILGGRVPIPALLSLALVVCLWLLLATTRFGLRTIAIGSSREAAARAGLPTARHVLTLFVLVGFLAGIAGVIDLSRFATTNLGGHQTDALSAIAGAVIGGTNLFGGVVSLPGAVLGSLLAVILLTGLVIQGLAPFYQQIAVGAVLILAVFVRGRETQERKGGRRRLVRFARATTYPLHRRA
jgi:ribose transport system permease protein